MNYYTNDHSTFDRAWTWSPQRSSSAVLWLIKVNVGVFIFFMLTNLFRLYGLEPLFALSMPGIQHGFVWQLVSYMFMHGGFVHILFNMMTLYFIGPEVERTMGTTHFLILYFLSGILGGIGWLFLAAPQSFCVGASAAIYGVLAAFATLYPKRRITTLIVFFPVTLEAWKLVLGISFIQLLLLTGGVPSNIAYSAHLAGAVVGYLYIRFVYSKKPVMPDWNTWLHAFKKKRSARTAHTSASSTTGRSSEPPPNQADIDRILDKVASQGIHSLSQAERDILYRASRNGF